MVEFKKATYTVVENAKTVKIDLIRKEDFERKLEVK